MKGCLFFFSRNDKLMTAGWKSKESFSQVTCLRWQRAKIESLLSQSDADDKISVNILSPGSSDKLGSLYAESDPSVFLDPKSYEDIDNGKGAQLTWESTIEIEGETKPALVAENIGRMYK